APWALFSLFLQVYGDGSAVDCRLHVQKLNLLQGEAEEARSWTPRCVEDSVDANKNTAVESEGRSLLQQVGKAEVSRWSKYLDESNETQDDDEESGERQEFCSWRMNTVEGQRKHQNSFPYTDVQELSEENGALQIANQAKKRKQRSLAVPQQGDGAAGCGDRMIPAACESAVPERSTQTPAAPIKPSKWEKFLSFSENCGETPAKVTLPPQEGSRKLGPPTTAADIFMASNYSRQAGNFLPRGLDDTEFKKCLSSTEHQASEAPGTTLPGTCSEQVLLKEPRGPLIGPVRSAALESIAGRGPGAHTALPMCPPPPTLILSPPRSTSHKSLFCTGEEFDDNL
ncbi:MRNIP protein, partial [Nothoprocta ornata]|nr:MRNIP protein [Nothoprocta ornata]